MEGYEILHWMGSLRGNYPLTSGAIGYGKENAGELVEKHEASRSMLDVPVVVRKGR